MTNKKRLSMALAVIFIVNIMLISLAQSAGAVVYKKGTSGDTVTKIQTVLKDWGYYTGSVDGIFGSQTETAVKSFQKNNGLAVDGLVGNATLAAMGISAAASSTSSSSSDLYLLARLISAEARGEPYSGQVAVGAVVLNRVDSPAFPNTISGVIYQSGAFTCMVDGQWNEPIADSAYRAAQDALAGYDPSGGAMYYFNPVTATSSWIWSRPLILQIGKHRFCS